MNKISHIVCLIVALFFLNGCNKNVDPNRVAELRSKSTARGDIIQRSGTMIMGDENAKLNDAENRLRTGGGLFGKKPMSLDLLNGVGSGSGSGSTVGMPINAILWKSSLETIDFMPIASADPFGGIIITDWYSISNSENERCKLNIFIKGLQLKSDNIKVNSFCQKYNGDGIWINQQTVPAQDREIENAILNKAKKLKLSLN